MQNDLTPHLPIGRLVWSDDVYTLQECLEDFPHPVYIVGGAVRDALMRRPIKDIDLATPANSIQLGKLIANHFNGEFYILDRERGVGRAIIHTLYGRVEIDVAQFRGDENTLLADLIDRDFTINAMVVDMHTDLTHFIDPLHGEQDVIAKVIRRCSPSSLANDPLRALRAIRQSVALNFRIEPHTLEDIKQVAGELERVSPERVRDELFKILAGRHVTRAIKVALRLNLLEACLPLPTAQQENALALLQSLESFVERLSPFPVDTVVTNFSYGLLLMQLQHLRPDLQTHLARMLTPPRPHQALLLLTPLLHPMVTTEAQLERFTEQLRLSRAEGQSLMRILQGWERFMETDDSTPLTIHRYWYSLQAEGIDVILLSLSRYLMDQGLELKQQAWIKLVEKAQHYLTVYHRQYDSVVSPPLLMNGSEIMQTFDLPPSKQIGKLLDALREAQVVGEVQTLEQAHQLISTYLGR
ncbi:MAG: hypothetical protein ACOYLB_03285 [Phototrophicaceae bacterium]